MNDMNTNKIKYREIKGKIIPPLPRHVGDGSINISTYKLEIYMYSETGHVTPLQKLCYQFFWHKNKICRQVNDSSRYPKNNHDLCAEYRVIICLKNMMCHIKYDSYQVVKINSLENKIYPIHYDILQSLTYNIAKKILPDRETLGLEPMTNGAECYVGCLHPLRHHHILNKLNLGRVLYSTKSTQLRQERPKRGRPEGMVC